MKQYLDIVERVLREGIDKPDRTGTGTIEIPSAIFVHDMSCGFPLITTRQMARKSILVELEGFIAGITDKKWYQERGCTIWDEWCNREIVSYGKDVETQKRMRRERDLGPFYGWQWRHFGAVYRGYDTDYSGQGADQVERVIRILKEDPRSRRMLVSAWNPVDLDRMALEPCHVDWKVSLVNEKLNLSWHQRSVDTMLGLPFNIASYATLLHLLSKESGFVEGQLIGHLDEVHIYKNHIENAKQQVFRRPFQLPKIVTERFTSIFSWTHKDTKFENYQSHPKIDYSIAI